MRTFDDCVVAHAAKTRCVPQQLEQIDATRSNVFFSAAFVNTMLPFVCILECHRMPVLAGSLLTKSTAQSGAGTVGSANSVLGALCHHALWALTFTCKPVQHSMHCTLLASASPVFWACVPGGHCLHSARELSASAAKFQYAA